MTRTVRSSPRSWRRPEWRHRPRPVEALIAYLESDAIRPPTTITAADEPADPDAVGWITSTIRQGELFLHLEGDLTSWFRLCWSPGDPAPRRPLMPGTYVVTGYRQLATAEDGAPWIWSSSSAGYRTVEVEAGETVHLDVKTRLALKAQMLFKWDEHHASLVLLAEEKLGNTLYRKGKRIALCWECLDEADTVLAEGPMKYG